MSKIKKRETLGIIEKVKNQNLNSCLLKTKRVKRAGAGTKTAVSLGFEF